MPIVVTRKTDALVFAYEGLYSEDELRDGLEELRAQLASAADAGGSVTLLSLTSQDAVATFRQRGLFAEWVEANDGLLRAACRAHAVVLHSPLQFAVYSTLLWLKPFPIPMQSFTTEVEAEEWLRAFRR